MGTCGGLAEVIKVVKSLFLSPTAKKRRGGSQTDWGYAKKA
jgi:hypothetical protein